MRNPVAVLALVPALAVAGCSLPKAPGVPRNNISLANTENTGDWNVILRQRDGDRLSFRVAAQYPERAPAIVAALIDQTLDQSPKQVTVEVVPAAHPDAPPVARVIWRRPDHVAVTYVRGAETSPPSAADRMGLTREAFGWP